MVAINLNIFAYVITFLFFNGNVVAQETNIIENLVSEDSVEVSFLNKINASVAILDETYEPYFSKLQIREICALTGSFPPSSNIDEARKFAREKFSSAVSNFSTEEKSAIKYVISVITEVFSANKLNIIANHPWKFIKIEDWLCGGFAHTRGEYIILSQRHISHLSSDWSRDMSAQDSIMLVKKLGALLTHEQFHSLQRKYPEKFELLYVDSWMFKKANVELDSNIAANQLINPDAPKAEWIVNYDDVYYWIRTLIREDTEKPQMGKDFTDVVFTLVKRKNNFVVAKDSSCNLIKQELSEFTIYTESFPVTQGLDHPNEITAYMISEYFISLLEGTSPFKNTTEKSKIFSQKYITWLNHNF